MVFAGDIERAGIIYNLIKERVDVGQFCESLITDNFGLTCLPEEIWRPHLALSAEQSAEA
jgi:hypothetical protein